MVEHRIKYPRCGLEADVPASLNPIKALSGHELRKCERGEAHKCPDLLAEFSKMARLPSGNSQ